MVDIYFWKQFFVCSGPLTAYFMLGMVTGLPTVLMPQLRKADQAIGIEHSSWVLSLLVYGGIPWVIIISVFNCVIGRKKTFIIVCISTSIGFIIYYCSTNISHFLIGTIFLGALTATNMTINIAIITEYTTAKHRGIFITIKSATFFWGILVANLIGTFFHWQNIIILCLICTCYTFINVISWPESPLWLVTKGKFVECSAAHRWLKGEGEESEKELERILKTYESRRFVKQQWSFRCFLATMCRMQFLKPILLANLLFCGQIFSGKLVCSMFAIDILKNISNSESVAYSGMLILDAISVTSMYLGSLLSRFLKRRIILIGFSVVGIIFMISISIYLYLTKLSVIEENKYISIFLLAAYSIAISFGPMTMCTAIIGELLPFKFRIVSMCIFALSFKLTMGTFIKMTPFFLKHLGIHGTFTLYAICSIVCLVLVYLYVPETKDKTIQEIDDCLKGNEQKAVVENQTLMNVFSRG